MRLVKNSLMLVFATLVLVYEVRDDVGVVHHPCLLLFPTHEQQFDHQQPNLRYTNHNTNSTPPPPSEPNSTATSENINHSSSPWTCAHTIGGADGLCSSSWYPRGVGDLPSVLRRFTTPAVAVPDSCSLLRSWPLTSSSGGF